MNKINFILLLLPILTGCDLICFPDRDGGFCGDWTSNQDTFYDEYYQDSICNDCVLELSVRDKEIQEDGHYHIDYYNDNEYTYAYIDAYVGNSFEYIGWATNIGNDAISGESYSDYDFIATAVLKVTEQNIGNIVKVYCGYYDDWGEQYLDSLEIIIDK